MTIALDPGNTTSTISPLLHGQFIEFLGECIDEGLWVGPDSAIPNQNGIRTDALEALKRLAPPLLRWPGGCYADTYHWRDGVGPQDQRRTTYNENFGTYELDRHGFGTDEYLRLCEQVGAQPWVNVNMLSGSVSEMRDWMEYCNRAEPTDLARSRAANGHAEPYGVRYWGLGNEPWAGGGTMTPSTYMDLYRLFASSMPSFTHSNDEPGMMYPIACGPDGNKPVERVEWTREFFRELASFRQPPISAYDLHFYNWNIDHEEDSSTQFDQAGWRRVVEGCLELEDIIDEQWGLIRAGLSAMPRPEVPQDPRLESVDLVIGEWGNWHRDAFEVRPALRQEVTMRDAVTTALTLDILQRNCDKISMACNAQTINVLNSLILTDGDATILTPNYDVFMMYQGHRGAQAIETPRQDQQTGVYAFASVKNRKLLVDLTNADMDAAVDQTLTLPVDVRVEDMRTLVGEDPHQFNSKQNPDLLRARRNAFDAPIGREVTAHLEPASVNTLTLSLA
ncbi:alpha-L-arabinosidase [Bifidobacterium actinocoloniiforme DSM 22766]|uniref:non-reducing end alpha-L-arabinofuranosidase n=1 Tax=Bifidobacterium actinocoloniiforme DSM 22766 TaxID=1437605 RepID=A0A086Z298_9BIFI|nr:alpha-L-arabinofuranosidase C-terminal domain-containing protein [Bifidobacterium actinocoloniiforme]AKV55666.1 alpha-L-arabinofuranosidase [Bifidobacterium actinocoloniiforme DSM 22766]KFI40648.1 alpha-L-arabinosidase [Bifidobacterium actinocoloniiforme DSM 22766]